MTGQGILVFAPDSRGAGLINGTPDGQPMSDSLVLLHAVRFSVGFLGLTLAALMDLRTRRVPNKVWWVMGVLAGILWLAEMHLRERPWEHFVLLGPLAVFFAYAFIDPTDWPWDGRRYLWHGLEIASLLMVAWLFYLRMVAPGEGERDWDFAALLAVPLLMGLMVAAYYAGLMTGGADVKALMTVALLAPTTSELAPWELMVAAKDLTVPMPFVIFGNSMLCYLVIPLLFLVWNLARRDWGPPWAQMLFGYRLPITEARERFIWPMERYLAPGGKAGALKEAMSEQAGDGEDGDERADHRTADESTDGPSNVTADGTADETAIEPARAEGRVLFELLPRNRHDTQEVLDDLEAAGRRKVWVTPKTPYMVPLLAAWVVSHLVGDIFFNLFIW